MCFCNRWRLSTLLQSGSFLMPSEVSSHISGRMHVRGGGGGRVESAGGGTWKHAMLGSAGTN